MIPTGEREPGLAGGHPTHHAYQDSMSIAKDEREDADTGGASGLLRSASDDHTQASAREVRRSFVRARGGKMSTLLL